MDVSGGSVGRVFAFRVDVSGGSVGRVFAFRVNVSRGSVRRVFRGVIVIAVGAVNVFRFARDGRVGRFLATGERPERGDGE